METVNTQVVEKKRYMGVVQRMLGGKSVLYDGHQCCLSASI